MCGQKLDGNVRCPLPHGERCPQLPSKQRSWRCLRPGARAMGRSIQLRAREYAPASGKRTSDSRCPACEACGPKGHRAPSRTVVVPVAPRPSLVHRWVLYWALLHHHQPQEDIRDVTPTEITQAPAVVVPVRPRSHWLTWAIIGVLGLVAFILWLRKALT
jgi:hypothetical protein